MRRSCPDPLAEQRKASAAYSRRLERARDADEPRLYFVYVLLDSKGVRYVGCTVHLAQRFSGHLGPSSSSRAMLAWLRSIAPEVPKLRVLHVLASKLEARRLEREAIAQLLAAAAPLVNLRDRPTPVRHGPQTPDARWFLPKRPRHLRSVTETAATMEARLRAEWKKANDWKPRKRVKTVKKFARGVTETSWSYVPAKSPTYAKVVSG